MEQQDPSKSEDRLDELFRTYRAVCPDPEPGVNFIPNMWAGIETREISTNWFGRVAKVLVSSALTLSAILGMMTSSRNQPSVFFNATFVEALRADQMSSLEPLNLDRISQLETERSPQRLR